MSNLVFVCATGRHVMVGFTCISRPQDRSVRTKSVSREVLDDNKRGLRSFHSEAAEEV
jgi:hypothetical protein